MMYLYDKTDVGFSWGHVSSLDLLHWRNHPDILLPDEIDGGIYSGGVYVSDDGTAYIAYWGLENPGRSKGGIRIAKSADLPFYEKWIKQDGYIVEGTEEGVKEITLPDGKVEYLACADPSNLWKENGKYYMQLGNLLALNKTRDIPAEPRLKGDWTELLESDNLVDWHYAHRFYTRKADNSQTDESEDCMCPCFFPLPGANGKYIQLFLAHNRGTQYYIGEYDRSRMIFVPEKHGRMSFEDNALFAPEAFIDDSGRLLMTGWFRENLDDDLEREYQNGWSGVYIMFRSLSCGEDGKLRIAPAKEYERLAYNKSTAKLCGKTALSCYDMRMCGVRIKTDKAPKSNVGLRVYIDGKNPPIEIYYSPSEKAIIFDTTTEANKGRRIRDKAPLDTATEPLALTVYVDKGAIEVFANEKQAMARRVFGTGECRIEAFAEGSESGKVEIWDMMPTAAF